MKQWIKFCIWTGDRAKLKGHPQQIIRKEYPDADNWCPESICDAWFFTATPTGREADNKPFSLAPGYATSPVAQASLRGENMAR